MIVVGTSGYHFKDWTGVFYPPELENQYWLDYYSKHFGTVEINTTYYGLPRVDTVARWAEQTPDNFEFFVKVHSDTTHKRTDNGASLNELMQVLSPLHEQGKLAGLLAQFPASFHNGDKERDYLRAVIRHTKGLNFFVEFRHYTWDTDDAVAFCREIGAGWVAVDLPRLGGLPGARPAVTTAIGYIRFHGRNSKTWYTPEVGDRYDWMYSDRELQQWLPRLKAMDQRAEKTYLFFNNCHAGQAIKSAEKMRQMLKNQYEVL